MEGTKKVKSRSIHQYSWNSEVETTWNGLIGWRHRTSNTYTYIRTVSFSYVLVHSFPSWLVLGRNQMYCACCSVQMANKLILTGSAKSKADAKTLLSIHIYTVILMLKRVGKSSCRLQGITIPKKDCSKNWAPWSVQKYNSPTFYCCGACSNLLQIPFCLSF